MCERVNERCMAALKPFFCRHINKRKENANVGLFRGFLFSGKIDNFDR